MVWLAGVGVWGGRNAAKAVERRCVESALMSATTGSFRPPEAILGA